MTQSDRSDRDRGSVVKVGGWTANPEGILQWCHGVNQQRPTPIHAFTADPESSHPSVSGKICAKVGDTHKD